MNAVGFWIIGIYVGVLLILGLLRSYFYGRREFDGWPDKPWLLLLWPLALLLIAFHGPFALATWLGEQSLRKDAMRSQDGTTDRSVLAREEPVLDPDRVRS